VLISSGDPHWTTLLRARLARSIPDVADRVVFLDRLSRDAYIGLLNISAVALDTFPFGGGNSSYDAFVAGTPVVCRPGPFLRSRITYALYRQMGIDDCLAREAQHYVDIALRLGRDPIERARVSRLICDRRTALVDNTAASDLEMFLIAAVDAAARGDRLDRPPGES
jgi:predicted O-linked N-acetylglucosamine transferase (SPINDLY family)